jgi:hypothetical protein
MNTTSLVVAVGSAAGLLVVAVYVNHQLVARGARRPLVFGVWAAPPISAALALLSSVSMLPWWTAVVVAAVLVGGAIWPKALIAATGGPIPLVRVASSVSRISHACASLEELSAAEQAATAGRIDSMLDELRSQASPELDGYVSEFTTVVRSWLDGVSNDAQADRLRRLEEAQREIASQMRERGVDISLLGT